MPLIRLPKERWGEIRTKLLEVGEIGKNVSGPVYVVSERHIEYLKQHGLPFEEVSYQEWKQLREADRAARKARESAKAPKGIDSAKSASL